MSQRDVDRDIDIYQASVEEHHRQLTRCLPGDERKHAALRYSAARVLVALKAYRDLVDMYQREGGQ